MGKVTSATTGRRRATSGDGWRDERGREALHKLTMHVPFSIAQAAKRAAIERSAPGRRVTMASLFVDAIVAHLNLKPAGRS